MSPPARKKRLDRRILSLKDEEPKRLSMSSEQVARMINNILSEHVQVSARVLGDKDMAAIRARMESAHSKVEGEAREQMGLRPYEAIPLRRKREFEQLAEELHKRRLKK